MDSSPEKTIFGEELMELVRECTAKGQSIGYLPFAGGSMLPMLRQGRDKVELSPLPEKLKKYDLPVYRFPSGKYVMHRVIKVEDDHYICNGDNLFAFEKVYPDQLIAIVSAFTRDGKRISVDSFGYKLYSRFWVFVRPIRHPLKRLILRLRKLKRRTH